MWYPGWRDRVWDRLDQTWDVVVIGGGITGAGIFREAGRLGMRALLVEANDFASGTSSRSSKLVHGGLRYLRNAQLKVTFESVSEREYLLRDGKGLINRLGFLYASMKGDKIPGWLFGMGLIVYDIMARRWSHRHYDALDLRELCPPLTAPQLRGGYRYFDAQTDDARLVLRIIRETVREGTPENRCLALNYAQAVQLLKTSTDKVSGVTVEDLAPGKPGRTKEISAHVVINAAGPWSDHLRGYLGKPKRMRLLRGSHLVVPELRLPLTRAVSFLHPSDGRPVFVIPWEGVTLVGTTDVDHGQEPITDPSISRGEAGYLLEMLISVFPDQEITPGDVQASFSGIRAVIGTGKANPSKESREHVIWKENGLLTVSGGKLTTFRIMAREALEAVRRNLPEHPGYKASKKILGDLRDINETLPGALKAPTRLRLAGRYTFDINDLLENAEPDELTNIEQTPYLWAELRWAAQAEGVVHLDDLLLRRVRLGLLLPNGALGLMDQIQNIVQPVLGWDDVRWNEEAARYEQLWRAAYQIPGI